MLEPITLLTGLLTVWAQVNNYGIDTEKYPHLKDIRVRRALESHLYAVENRDHNTKTDFYPHLKPPRENQAIETQPFIAYNKVQKISTDSVIMNVLGVVSNRRKRSYNDYIEGRIPLANYPKNSPYYSQNTAGVPYYYSPYDGNNNGYNHIDNNRNITIDGSVSPYQANTAININNQNYRYTQINRNMTSGKYLMGFNLSNSNTTSNEKSFYSQATVRPNLRYNPFNGSNQTVMLNNGYNNNTIIDNKVNNSTERVETATIKVVSIIASIGCPKFMRRITMFGTKVCVDDNYDY